MHRIYPPDMCFPPPITWSLELTLDPSTFFGIQPELSQYNVVQIILHIHSFCMTKEKVSLKS